MLPSLSFVVSSISSTPGTHSTGLLLSSAPSRNSFFSCGTRCNRAGLLLITMLVAVVSFFFYHSCSILVAAGSVFLWSTDTRSSRVNLLVLTSIANNPRSSLRFHRHAANPPCSQNLKCLPLWNHLASWCENLLRHRQHVAANLDFACRHTVDRFFCRHQPMSIAIPSLACSRRHRHDANLSWSFLFSRHHLA